MIHLAFKKLFRMRENAARLRPGADEGFDAHEKPFLDHLEDLRHTLFKIIATLSLSTILCFAFHKWIFELVQYPAKVKMAEIAPGIRLWEKLELITLGPTEFIILMLKLSFFSGLIITFPFTVYFLFQFIIPGLRESEKRAVIPGVVAGFGLFIVGATFAFFLAAPMALKYFYVFENSRISTLDPVSAALEKPISEVALVGFDGERIPPLTKKEAAAKTTAPPAADEGAPGLSPEMKGLVREYLKETLTTAEGANFALRYDEARDKMVLVVAKGGRSSYQIGKYIGFITQLILIFGISFQMPIVVTLLVKLDLLTASVMRNTRSYAWVIILVLSAILTPPDVITLALLGGPLIILYEVCIVMATIIEKARARKERAEEKARKSRLEQLYLKPAAELSEEEKAELHQAEIEQYEKEHAHLYLEESEHVSRDSLHGGDPDPSEDPDIDDLHHGEDIHDESWHADDHYWHEEYHHQMESDHAEVEDLSPGTDESSEDTGEDEPASEAKSEEPANESGEDEEASETKADEPTAESEGDEPEAKEEASGDSESAEPRWEEPENCAPDGPVVNLNYATLEELQTLPGIDQALAEALIEYRPYVTFGDLDRVPGLEDEIIRRITERISLG